jgi:[acyl-carrier-protein] S-malonyltransferase
MDQPGVAFPGQVSDGEALGRQLGRYRDHPLVVALAERVGGDPATANFADTRVALPCTYVAGLVAAWDTVGPPEGRVPLVIGHSLGEVTAMAYTGALDPYDGLRLICGVGDLGDEQHWRRPSALVAIVGLDAVTVEWHRRNIVAVTGGVLEPSGYNDPRQTVLCGDEAAVDAMVARVRAGVGAARRLPIRGGYHSSLMVEALPRFRASLARLRFRPPRVPLLSTVDGCVRTDAAGLPELLSRWLVLPVRWHEATEAAARLGVRTLWNAGPGDILRRIGRRGGAVEFVEPAGVLS